ncbi:MAG: T9SS type A sorting domain-containing protein [Bacteroidetes bacterium]|nr:T9SS type A sorting domain-containing protein [Bacteroidota bacterium]
MLKNRYAFLIATALSLTVAHAQTIHLVQDLNVGIEDALDEFNYKSVQLGSDLYFSANNGTEGYEPYMLKNGTLEMLSDIATGAESSSPTEFTIYNDKVYFTAYDAVNGGALWSTDGTPTGTVMEFTPSASATTNRPTGLTVAKNGALYFAFGNKLYKSFGTSANTSIVPGGVTVEFSENSTYTGLNYTPYEEGIAFISKENKVMKLWYAQDSIVKLGEATCDSYYFDYFGLNQVKDGLVFAVRSSFDPAFNGLYHYSPTLDTLHKLPVKGVADANVGRVFRLNKDRVIVLEYSNGFVSVDGTGTNDYVIATEYQGFSSGVNVNHTIVGDYAIFHSSDQSFSFIVTSTNGTVNGSTTIAQPDQPFSSNFITYGNYAIWAAGVSNGFVPQIWYADPYHGTSGTLYVHPQGAFNIKSIIMVGVQDNKLYFFSNLNTDIGRELYYLPLEITSTKEEKELDGYTITNKAGEIYVSTPTPNQELDVHVYDVAGRLVADKKLISNSSFQLEGMSGIYFIEAHTGSYRFTKPVFIAK